MYQPYLIFFSKEGCGFCEQFKPQWEIIKKTLSGKVRFLRVRTALDAFPNPCFLRFLTGFPCIVLVSYNEYHTFFDTSGKPTNTWKPDRHMNVHVYGHALINGKYVHLHQPFMASNIIDWIEIIVPKVLRNENQIDYRTVPAFYS